MSAHASSYVRLGLAVAAATVALDQAHKWYMLLIYRIQERGRVTVTPFMDLVFVKNEGISYGLFTQGSMAGQYFLAVFAVLASALMVLWLAKGVSNRLLAWGVGFIIGGAIGNAIDRILLGGVADFFSLHAFGYYWYVFNIADVAIVAGVAALLYDSFILSRSSAPKSTQ